jgi:hypothetical protein
VACFHANDIHREDERRKSLATDRLVTEGVEKTTRNLETTFASVAESFGYDWQVVCGVVRIEKARQLKRQRLRASWDGAKIAERTRTFG